MYAPEFDEVLGDAPRLSRVTEVDAHEGPVYFADENALYFTTLPKPGPRVSIKRLDLGTLETLGDVPRLNDVFCCLGTTIKRAGSQPAFRLVDHTFVVGLARAGLRAGATQFLLVSAIGADPASRIFYSRVKGETEAAVRKLPYRSIQIFRPSLLLGDRAEFRLGERIATLGAPMLSVLLFGRLRRYRPIHAATVARAMVTIAREAPLGPNVFEYAGMRASLVA